LEKRDQILDDYDFNKELDSISELNVEDTTRTLLRAKDTSKMSTRVSFQEAHNLHIRTTDPYEENLPLFEKKLMTVHNDKLHETAKANMNLLKNIQRLKF
jgi:hypothetical protein